MDRIARYSGLKNRSSQMARYIKTLSAQTPNDRTTAKLAKNVSECANYLLFHDYYTIDQLRLVKAVTCKKSLLCPFCAARRAAKQVEKNIPKVNQVMASNGSLKPVMVTLTVKNRESLPEAYQHLKEAYRRLQLRRRDARQGKGHSEFARLAGGIHSYEFTKSAEGWHPHIHIVALLESWIDQKALSREWHAITGDSFIVDVRRIQPGEDGLASGMLEVFKYALKFHDLDLSDTWHAHQVLNKRRLIGSFGVLRGLEQPESLLDDLLDGLPFNSYYYVFSHRTGAYDMHSAEFGIQPEEPPPPLSNPPFPAAPPDRGCSKVKGSGREPRPSGG